MTKQQLIQVLKNPKFRRVVDNYRDALECECGCKEEAFREVQRYIIYGVFPLVGGIEEVK